MFYCTKAGTSPNAVAKELGFSSGSDSTSSSSINTFFDTAVSAVLIEYHFLFSTQTFGILL